MFNKVYDFFKKSYKTIILIIVIAFVMLYEFPYVIYTPGGIVELDKRVVVEDGYSSDGSFNMSYVSMRRGNLPTILLSFIIPNWDLLKESEVTNDSVDDLLELEKLYMTSSIDNATILAYQEAAKSIDVTNNVNHIVYITDEANTNLEVYDELISADGKEVNDINDLKDIVNSHEEGDTISLMVNRDGKEHECYAKIYSTADGLKIGISFLTTYEYETDPAIEVKTKTSESGSSGGLMLSLAIYNSLVEEDITHGLTIVGTGTIDTSGNVGEIDGVKYKLLGAEKSGGDLFFCPKENYQEAMEVKEEFDLDLDIVSVETFTDALAYLDNM